MNQKILVIDDDPLNNILSSYIIKKELKTAEVNCFEKPTEGLEHLLDIPIEPPPTILFLDINMPEMNGWEFLEEFKKFDSRVQNQFRIYILSSSINPADIEKANSNIFVKDFISKPLNETVIQKIIQTGY